ncbi:MAG: DUF5110 domain-containing protein [Phycisphaerales bacterium]|nr:DUF5110 domain-containing protein [Phycisphaerales bacterium]
MQQPLKHVRSSAALAALIAAALFVSAGRAQQPKADPAACIVVDHARFSILTPALIRIEWAPDGKFEDRASYAFINRQLPVPEIRKSTQDGWLTIQTRDLKLRYKLQSEALTADSLSIELMVAGQTVTWRPGTPEGRNLRGTTRTLDGVSGACPLEPGLVSRDGWVLVDDSARPLFDSSDWPWAIARPAPTTNSDWYFFGYGHDYQQALRDFTLVAGKIPLPPRYALGAWWSRYWAYRDAELRELVNEFNDNHVPLDVLVIDMDWHLDGWTGYTWNPGYFPDPPGFLAWVKQQGLRATLNLHPAEGVGKHETAFTDFAKALGFDPATIERIAFAPTDRRYVEAYFKYLHHPLERMGIDFWWMDYQQSRETNIPGLDPLPWLNYLHWSDMERNPDRAPLRPMLFSRWGGLGNHRYQIGFSGDTYCDWPSLAFQPYFTATAGNVGFTFWSHDIGGHQPGNVEPELYTRWVQWGALSPALRTHTTKNAEAERRIWKFPEEYFHAMRGAFHLRYQLVPYIYTAMRRCHDMAVPLVRPLYYAWPELDEAYENGGQYLFGDQMMVAPVTQPRSDWSRCAEVRVWIPPGEWTYWHSGRRYEGPAYALIFVPLDEIPIFTQAGAIIPMQTSRLRVDEAPLDPLVLNIVNGFSGATSIYEDDGVTSDYLNKRCAWTPIQHIVDQGARQVVIGAMSGDFDGALKQRRYEFRFRDSLPPGEISVDGQMLARTDGPGKVGWWYDTFSLAVVVHTPMLATSQEHKVSLKFTGIWDDEAPLARGIRGRHDFANILLSKMGTNAPQALRDLAALGGALAGEPSQARELLSRADAHWQEAIRAVSRSEALSATDRCAALLRMMEIPIAVRFSEPRVSAYGDSMRTTVQANVDVGAPAFDAAGDLTFNVAAEIDAPWRTEPADEKRIALSVDSPPQTAVLRASVNLSLADTKLILPISRTIFPSINQWWVIGPFDANYEKSLATPYPPEQGINLAAEYTGKDGAPLRWREVTRPLNEKSNVADEFFVHLHTVFGKRIDNAVAYAATSLIAPNEMQAQLALGSDDGVVVWLNGVEIHRNNIGRPYAPKQDVIPIRLKQGPNTLLLKINQGGGDWGFGAHVETAAGKPLTLVTTGKP